MKNKTTNEKQQDLIRYDQLVQEALRDVVKQVINEIAAIGELPGHHHFYITFDTNANGVKLSKTMKQKYPKEMTIVIQHQYRDLKTTEKGFSITLSFNHRPEHLTVPYNAISGFFDPSVGFGLQFEQEKIAQVNKKTNKKTNKKIKNENDIKENMGDNIISLNKFRK